MHVNLLGPLEVLRNGEPVALGGVHRRATLAYLLLHAGTVVSTGDLVQALWGDDAPPTARKMVQNAVAGLRRALRADDAPDAPALLTAAPGYLLRVSPAQVDVTRFHELVRQGRTAFRAAAWQPAARLLREALALWRGPALADVAETGRAVRPAWPELATLDEQRLTVLEDCVEAELALGLHRELVGELTPLAEEEPARERLCGLLMLALYRCGQQSEALAVFRRTRAALVEELGIDPAPELHRLQHAILNQDPALTTSTVAVGTAAPEPDERPARPAPDGAPRPLVERKHASVLLVRARVPDGIDDPEQVAEALAALDRAVTDEAARYGGLVRATLGSVRLVVFGVPRVREDDPVRAVRAALAIRARLTGPAAPAMALRLAVATGDVLASYRDEDDPEPAELAGGVLEQCECLLERATGDAVRVCDRTRQEVGARFGHADVDPAGGWRVTAPRPPRPAPAPDRRPLLGRDRELTRLFDVLDDVRRRRRPHLVTVLGEPGLGRTRLAAEFRTLLPDRAADVRCLHAAVPPSYEGEADPLAEIVRSHAGFTVAPGRAGPRPGDGPPRPACPADRLARATGPAELFAAWLRYLEVTAADGPLVVVLDDLHHVGAELLGLLEELTERVAAVPLLVVATARPELLHRRPRWCGGRRDAHVLTLDPLPDDATAALLGGADDLLPLVAGNPLVALEYAQAYRRHTAAGTPPVPRRVTALFSARLDTLPAAQKAVLRHAAVLGPAVRPAGVAAVSGRAGDEVAALLRALDREGLLRRLVPGPTPGEDEYAFAHPLLRDVAYAQVPHRHRAAGRRRAEEWAAVPDDRRARTLTGRPGGRGS